MKSNFHKIRIIAGKLRGQIIQTINNHNYRPTLSRIRETLFNWLSPVIINSNCLDCFSGSGALSIEAISRSAKHVTALEKNKKTLLFLKKNIFRLKIYNIDIIHTNTLLWLKKQSQQYDIIFLDPPYNKNILKETIYLIQKRKLIKKFGYIYIESNHKNIIKCPKNWILYKNKHTKNINYQLYFFY